jgi:multidrug resistance efflux pump
MLPLVSVAQYVTSSQDSLTVWSPSDIYIGEVYVRNNETVKIGDPILKFDSFEIDQKLSAALNKKQLALIEKERILDFEVEPKIPSGVTNYPIEVVTERATLLAQIATESKKLRSLKIRWEEIKKRAESGVDPTWEAERAEAVYYKEESELAQIMEAMHVKEEQNKLEIFKNERSVEKIEYEIALYQSYLKKLIVRSNKDGKINFFVASGMFVERKDILFTINSSDL